MVEEISEEQPKARPRRTYTRRAGNSGRTTTRTGRQKVVTKPQPKKSRTTTRTTVTDKQKAEIRAALKGAELSAPDYKKVYDAFTSCENASAYNNKLQKSLGNDKTSVVYKATSKIFENAKKYNGLPYRQPFLGMIYEKVFIIALCHDDCSRNQLFY